MVARVIAAGLRPRAGFVVAGAVLAATTAGLAPFAGEGDLMNVTLVYLLVVLLAAAAWGYAVGLGTALAAALLVNFFFVEPLHTLAVASDANAVALAVFLAVALIGATMLALLQRQARLAEARRREASLLLEIAHELAQAVSPRDALQRLCLVLARTAGASTCTVLAGPALEVVASGASLAAVDREEAALAAAAMASGEVVARRGRQPVTFVPFPADAAETGVLRFGGALGLPPWLDRSRLLRAFAAEASLALSRARFAAAAAEAESLRRSADLQAAILGSVSHDLRTPLAAIAAAVESLQDARVRWSDEDRATMLETIAGQTRRLTATVRGLLEMSRLEAAAVQPRLEPIAARPLLYELAEAAASLAPGRALEVDVAGEPWLRADYALLMQALTNLVDNAANYSTPGLPIRLLARADGQSYQVAVQDGGPGIAAAEQARIFDKFYRGAGAAGHQGSGLGLSIARALAEVCGGKLTCQSGATGSTFTIALPAVSAPTVLRA